MVLQNNFKYTIKFGQPTRQNRLYVCDVDGTLRDGSLIVEAANYNRKIGLADPQIIAGFNSNLLAHQTRHIDYRKHTSQVQLLYARSLRGRKRKQIETAGREFVDRYGINGVPCDNDFMPPKPGQEAYCSRGIFPKSVELVVLLKELGYPMLASASSGETVRPLNNICFKIPDKFIVCSELEYDSQDYATGNMRVTLKTGTDKLNEITEAAPEFKLRHGAYFGDSTGDLPAMRSFGAPFPVLNLERLTNPSDDFVAGICRAGWQYLVLDPKNFNLDLVRNVLIVTGRPRDSIEITNNAEVCYTATIRPRVRRGKVCCDVSIYEVGKNYLGVVENIFLSDTRSQIQRHLEIARRTLDIEKAVLPTLTNALWEYSRRFYPTHF